MKVGIKSRSYNLNAAGEVRLAPQSAANKPSDYWRNKIRPAGSRAYEQPQNESSQASGEERLLDINSEQLLARKHNKVAGRVESWEKYVDPEGKRKSQKITKAEVKTVNFVEELAKAAEQQKVSQESSEREHELFNQQTEQNKSEQRPELGHFTRMINMREMQPQMQVTNEKQRGIAV